MNFQAKRILITGGSAGIGLALAIELAQRGAHLALIARDPTRLEAACAQCRAVGGEARPYTCDVTDKHALAQTIAQAAKDLGGLDGVIANSGYCHPGYFHKITLEDADRQLDTNIKGTIYTLHHALPHLLQTKGFAAITSSPAGSLSIFGFSLYGATKAALNHLAHTLRHEYRNQGVRIHLLLPPDTDTPGYQQEILLYPPECKSLLSGSKLFTPQHVAKIFINGIAKGQNNITVGTETKLAMLLTRLYPPLWEWYVARVVKKAAK